MWITPESDLFFLPAQTLTENHHVALRPRLLLCGRENLSVTLQKQLGCVRREHYAFASQNRTAQNLPGGKITHYRRETHRFPAENRHSATTPQPADKVAHSPMFIGLTLHDLLHKSPPRGEKYKNEQANLVPIPDTTHKPPDSVLAGQSSQTPGLGNSGAPPCAF